MQLKKKITGHLVKTNIVKEGGDCSKLKKIKLINLKILLNL